MPVTNWNTAIIDGDNYLIIDLAKLRIPLDWDANGNVFLAVSAPDGIDGDALFSYPGLVKGDDGDPPNLDEVVDLTVLDADDPTPDFAKWIKLGPNEYQYQASMRRGPEGPPGTLTIHLADDIVGTMTPGSTLVVNSTGDGFIVVGQKVGDWYLPAEIADTPSGNPSFTVCQIPIPPQPNDYRPECDGQIIADAGLGIDCITDFVARLNTAGGNELARCFGVTYKERLILAGGPPTGSPDTWDRIPANTPANILFRVERRAGWDTATTSATTTRARVRVCPIP